MRSAATPRDQFYDDMMRVTQGLSDPELAQILVSQSLPTMRWMRSKGVRFVLSYGRQAFRDEAIGKYRFWGGLLVEAVGAGKGLSDQQFDVCRAEGIEVRYSTQAKELLQDPTGRVNGVRVLGPEGVEDVYASSVVLAAGGFEANAEMRCRYLGPGWELVKVRGIPYNTGDGIRMALDAGAMPHGHWSSCHAVAWDLNAPAYGDRTITELFQKHSYPFGLIVNLNGERFLDEGYDFRNYTYVTYGRALLTQPQGVAFQIFDDKVKHLLRDEYHIPQVTMAQADSIEELARRLDIDPEGLADYHQGVQRGGADRRSLQPNGQGRTRYRRPLTQQDQLGPAHRHASLSRLRGYVRDFLHLRRRPDRQPGPRVEHQPGAVTGAVRGGRDGGRPVLPQLPGRVRSERRHGLRPPGRQQRRSARRRPTGLAGVARLSSGAWGGRKGVLGSIDACQCAATLSFAGHGQARRRSAIARRWRPGQQALILR